MRRDRRGFTLIELLVALAIGGVVLVAARGLLDGLAADASAIVRAMHTADLGANAERLARQVVENIALAPDTRPTFVGSATEAVFDSWCPSRRGGLECCQARLALSGRVGERALILSLSTGQTIDVLHGASPRVRYLWDTADGGHWTTEWSETQTPPLAIEASAGREVLLLRVGERR